MRYLFLCTICFELSACFLDNPVEEVASPSEYEYNYWLLSKLYLYDDLPDSAVYNTDVQALYDSLDDPYTRYYPPATSEDAAEKINTSTIPGDIGLEFLWVTNATYPLMIYRVYSDAPAGRAGVPRYGILRSANGHSLTGDSAYSLYKSILAQNTTIDLTVHYNEQNTTYHLIKETIWAPTVFVDSVASIPIISITGFKETTVDQENGTYGELKEALLQTQGASIRILDLRNNPGGNINQCIPAADLFVSRGLLSERTTRLLDADGNTTIKEKNVYATSGDIGEEGQFVLLVNSGTASCAEIFTAAIAENTETPIAGTTTFGKGIGQTEWKTPAGGLALITDIEFKTPNGYSYNKTGIEPNNACPTATLDCAMEVIYGESSLEYKKQNNSDSILSHPQIGGAVENL